MPSTTAEPIPVVKQYLVDLSFENPAAQFARVPAGNPELSKGLDVKAHLRNDGRFNVDLTLTVSGSSEGVALFLIQMTYRCVCDVTGLPEEDLEQRLLVSGGSHMFPAVQALVRSVMIQGGYTPTLTLDPIDFEAVYHQSKAG